MIILMCNLVRLRISDITPALVLSHGTVEVDDRIVQRSAQLRKAIQIGEVNIITKPARPARPERGLKKKRADAPVAPLDYEVPHNRFVGLLNEAGPPHQVDTETHRLLRQLIASVDRIDTTLRHTELRSVPHLTTQSSLLSGTPSYIPSDLRERGVKSSRIRVAENTEESGLEDAEAALRKMKDLTPY